MNRREFLRRTGLTVAALAVGVTVRPEPTVTVTDEWLAHQPDSISKSVLHYGQYNVVRREHRISRAYIDGLPG